MLLVVDVGNTQTHFGTFRDDELLEHWRFATVRESTADELGAALRNLLELRGVGMADLTASIVSSTVPQLGPEWSAMAERYLGHEMLVVGPGMKTGMALRYDNPREIGADRLVNAVAAYDKVRGACVVVDFGTAINYDPVSAEGEYLGGIISPGVEISMEALTSRAAKLPQIDLGPPRVAHRQVDGRRDPVGDRLRLRRPGRRDHHPAARRARRRGAHDRDRRPRRAHRPVLRHGGRDRRPAHADGAQAPARAQRMRQLTDSWALGPLTIPNRVVLAPLAGIGNWFVRLQAQRHGAGLAVSEMVSSFGIHYGNEKTINEMLRIHPEEGIVSIQLFGQDPEVMRSAAAAVAETGAHLIDLNMGCPVPKVCKTGAGAALLKDPDTAVAVARAAAEGSGLPVTVKLRSGQRKGETDGFELAHRLVDEAGVAAIGFHPRSRPGPSQGRAGLRPRGELVASLAAPVILTGGMNDAASVRAAFEHTGAEAVMLARGGLGNPWLFEQLLGRRDGPADARRGPRRARLGDGPRRRAPRPRAGGPLPAQVLPLVRRAPRRRQGAPGRAAGHGDRRRCPSGARRRGLADARRRLDKCLDAMSNGGLPGGAILPGPSSAR